MSIDCKHEKVVRREDGSWHCDLCEEEFYHLGNLQRGKIQFTRMPEVATLRDQFAIAAMIGDMIQCGVLQAALMINLRDRSRTGKVDAEAAREYYETADLMLEARK